MENQTETETVTKYVKPEFETRTVVDYDMVPKDGKLITPVMMTLNNSNRAYGDNKNYYFYSDGDNDVTFSYAPGMAGSIIINGRTVPVEKTEKIYTSSTVPQVVLKDINKDNIVDLAIKWSGWNELEYTVVLSKESGYIEVVFEDEAPKISLVLQNDYKIKVASEAGDVNEEFYVNDSYAQALISEGIYDGKGELINKAYNLSADKTTYAEVEFYDVSGELIIMAKKHIIDSKWSVGVSYIYCHKCINGTYGMPEVKVVNENWNLS